MSLAILFHFLCDQHVSDINISIFRSFRNKAQEKQTHYFKRSLTPSPHTPHEQKVVLQPAKRTPPKTSRTKSPTHNELRYVQSQIHITKYINNALITKQPIKNTTNKRTQWSQSIIDSGQYQLKYAYQLQQSDKTHHTKHTPIYTVNLH